MFDKLASLWMQYSRMSPASMYTRMVSTAAIGAVLKNLLYCILVRTQLDLDHMTCGDFEHRTTHYCLEHVCHIHDKGSHVLAAVDITDARQSICDIG